MNKYTINIVFTHYALKSELIRGIMQIITPMKEFSENRIQVAKERLREKLSYDKLIKLPQYRKLTEEQYEQLISSVEMLCIVLIETYINGTNI